LNDRYQEHDVRFDGLDGTLDLVLQKVGDVNTRLDGFIGLMKSSPLWRLMKVTEG